MIDDPNHSWMEQAKRGLFALLAGYRGKDLTGPLLDRLMSEVAAHRRMWRWKGVDFPPLVPLVNEGKGYIELVRADLDREGILACIRNFIIRNPELTSQDIAIAVKRAWPDLRKGFVMETSEEHKSRIGRSLARRAEAPTPTSDVDQDLVDKAVESDPALRKHYEEMN
jgi:hypothetical protein